MWKKQKQYNTFMKDNLGGKRAEALRHIAFFFFSVSLTPEMINTTLKIKSKKQVH